MKIINLIPVGIFTIWSLSLFFRIAYNVHNIDELEVLTYFFISSFLLALSDELYYQDEEGDDHCEKCKAENKS